MNEFKSMLTFGIYVLVSILCIIFAVVYSKKTKNGGADERQILFQGKCNNIGFFAMTFANFLSFGAIRTFEFAFHTEIFFPISLMIGGAAFLISGIFTDCLITKIETKKIFSLIGIVWLCIIGKSIYNVNKSDAIENKILLCFELIVTVAIIVAIVVIFSF